MATQLRDAGAFIFQEIPDMQLWREIDQLLHKGNLLLLHCADDAPPVLVSNMSPFTYWQSPDESKVSDSQAVMKPASGSSSLGQPGTGAGSIEDKGWAEGKKHRTPKPDGLGLKAGSTRESGSGFTYFLLSDLSLKLYPTFSSNPSPMGGPHNTQPLIKEDFFPLR